MRGIDELLRLGAVEHGNYIADEDMRKMVQKPGDPLEDVTRLENVRFVMKEGVVYPAADAAP